MNRIKNLINRKLFNYTVAKIRSTQPIKYRRCDSVSILSMVGHDSVDMYLLSIKSFLKNFGRGNVQIVNDGTLTSEDIELLKFHVPSINITHSDDIDTYDGPSYVSWKRLYRAQALSAESYVIQLDSDVITLAPVVEVDNLVRSNHGFLVGANRWSQAVDVTTLHDIVSHWDSDHVQAKAEANFHKLSFYSDGTKYLRGCAGFAGYPKNFATVDEIRSLSNEIEHYVGSSWKKWGSEQTTTMSLISKCDGSKILPWPSYQNYNFPKTNEITESMNLIHFIGTHRYSDSKYSQLASNVIAGL